MSEEVSYIDSLLGKNKRPDIVVYVNGIALAVIELKRSLVNYEEGIKQHLSNERDFIPSFFTTTQFTIASNDDVEFRYGTIGTPLPFWCKCKRDTNKVGDTITEKEAYRLFFDKENFMFFFHYGVLNDGGIKKVLRPHQIYAIKAAAKRMPQKERRTLKKSLCRTLVRFNRHRPSKRLGYVPIFLYLYGYKTDRYVTASTYYPIQRLQ